VLCFIRPEGKLLIDKQLQALQPDFISTETIYRPLLTGWQEKILTTEDPIVKTDTAVPSHTYTTGKVVARLFDPACQDIFTPKAVLSDLLYLSGIRDGLVGLDLGPGDIFTAPGFNETLTQPSFVLSVLLNGATCLHLSMQDIQKDPDLLTRYPLKTVGIISELRNLLIERPLMRPKIWESWFRDPSEACDMQVWERFITKLELLYIPAGSMLWNAAMGGCLLFSRKRAGQALQNLTPMPGRKWELVMTTDEKTKALGGIGLFCVNSCLNSEPNVYLPTPWILAQIDLETLFVGFNLPTKKGMYYPRKLVANIVRTKTAGCGAVVMEIPGIGGHPAGFHLLVFTGTGHTGDPADLIKQIHQTIRSTMGNAFCVDEIRLFPLFPRRTQTNGMDENWCSSQYLNGGLDSKSKNPLFRDLSRIRELAFRHPPSPKQLTPLTR
jgi:hypothetical protein